jgi:membrane protein YdbS with pleckstrin-like domain
MERARLREPEQERDLTDRERVGGEVRLCELAAQGVEQLLVRGAEIGEASAQGAHAHVERVGDVLRGWIAAAELRREDGTHAIGEVVHFGEPTEQVSCVTIEHVDEARVGARVREVERGGRKDDRVLVRVEAQRGGEDPLVLGDVGGLAMREADLDDGERGLDGSPRGEDERGDDELRDVTRHVHATGKRVADRDEAVFRFYDDARGIVVEPLVARDPCEAFAEGRAAHERVGLHVEHAELGGLGDVEPERVVAGALDRDLPERDRGSMRDAGVRIGQRGGIEARVGDRSFDVGLVQRETGEDRPQRAGGDAGLEHGGDDRGPDRFGPRSRPIRSMRRRGPGRACGPKRAPKSGIIAGAMPLPVAIAAIERPHPRLWTLYLLRALLTGPALVVALPVLWFRYHSMRYRFDEQGVHMRWGILFRREINLTYRRIQDIHLRSGLFQRWLGLADVLVQTAAGSASAEMTIEGLREFEAVRDFLYTRMRGHETRGGEPATADPAIAALREATAELARARIALERLAPQTGEG